MRRGDESRIAVLDWNRGGHHPTYLAEYVGALRAMGFSVAVLTADPLSVPALAGRSGVVVRSLPGMPWVKARRWLTWRGAEALFAAHVGRTLALAERELGGRCGRVFLSCLYEGQARLTRRIVAGLARPCAGLYLHAGVFHSGLSSARKKRVRETLAMLSHPGLECVYVLDEAVARAVSEASGKRVLTAPDFTDERAADGHPLPAGVELAPGRPVIGLLGHLRPSKGVADLARIAVEYPELDATFLFAGELKRAEFSADELGWLDRARALRGRVVFHEARVPDGPDYNAVVRACDVLYAVYRRSPHSSNMLTKAAVFERPVLVGDGFLMARNVRDFRLGEVVPEGDVPAAAAALGRLAGDADWRARASPRWAEFAALHSTARLGDALRAYFGGVE